MPSSSSGSSRPQSETPDLVHRHEFESFERNVTRSFDDVSRSIADTRSELGRALADQARKIDDMRTSGTDWKSIIGFASLVITIISVVGGLVAYGINTRIDANSTAIAKHRDLPGHPESIVNQASSDGRILALEVGTLKLDETLQREMRLLDDRVQSEMRLLDAHQDELSQTRFQQLHASLQETRKQVASIGKEFENRLDTIESSRFGSEDGLALLREVADLKVLMNTVNALLHRVETEQRRRTDKVYEKPKPGQ